MAASGSKFRVVCAGLTYRSPGDDVATGFAMRGTEVELDAKESKRLVDLAAVVPSGDPDPVVVVHEHTRVVEAVDEKSTRSARAK